MAENSFAYSRRGAIQAFVAGASLLSLSGIAWAGGEKPKAGGEQGAGDDSLGAVSWEMRPEDYEFRSRYVEPYLPDKVFDAHAHIFAVDNWPGGRYPSYLGNMPKLVDIDLYRKFSDQLIPGGRLRGGMFFGLPFEVDETKNNLFVADQIHRRRAGFAAFGEMLVTPGMDAEYIRQEVRKHGFIGLKPHFLLLRRSDASQARIEEFLPEAQVRVAHEERLLITLHVARSDMIADPGNLETLKRLSRLYPDARIILAHAGVSEHPWATLKAAESLGNLPNIWWDSSGICTSGVFEVIITRLGHARLLFGTDFWASQIRGRYISIGDRVSFVRPDPGKFANEDPASGPLKPTLVGLESLSGLLFATRLLRLADSKVEDIFYNNASQLIAGRS